MFQLELLDGLRSFSRIPRWLALLLLLAAAAGLWVALGLEPREGHSVVLNPFNRRW